MSALRNTLKQDAFWKLNKVFVHFLGIEEAVILTMMIDKFYYYQDENKTVFKDGKEWFFYTSESIKYYFKISYKVQKRVLDNLELLGYIYQKNFGVPCKVHFSLDEIKIFNLVNTSIPKRENPVLPKGENWNCQKGETIIKNIEIKNIDTNSLSNDKDAHNDLFAAAGINVPTKEKPKRKNSGQKEKVLMCDSLECDVEYVKEHIGEKFLIADIVHYHEAAFDWSKANNKKMADWCAVIRGFIRRAIEQNKLVRSDKVVSEKLSTPQDYLNYILQSQE